VNRHALVVLLQRGAGLEAQLVHVLEGLLELGGLDAHLLQTTLGDRDLVVAHQAHVFMRLALGRQLVALQEQLI
jgi:hypothetical protein